MSVYIGELRAFAFMNMCPPRGWMVCDGAERAITDHPALFALIGTQFGGDGTSTFALPDLRGRTPVGVGQGTDLEPVKLGDKRGQESISLSVAQLPAHSHNVSIPVSVDPATALSNKLTPDTAFSYMAASPTGSASAAIWSNTLTNPIHIKGVGSANAGSGGPVSTLPPQLGIAWCIAVEGIFPSKA